MHVSVHIYPVSAGSTYSHKPMHSNTRRYRCSIHRYVMCLYAVASVNTDVLHAGYYIWCFSNCIGI